MRRVLSALLAFAPMQAGRPLQIDDLYRVLRVADPQVSSTGDVAYQVGTVDLAANKVRTQIWVRWANRNNGFTGYGSLVDLGEGSQSRPRFSPDGSKLAYQSGGQVWVMDLATMARTQITKLSGGAENQLWSPDGTWIAFTSVTVPSGDEAENAAYVKAKDESKVKAYRTDQLSFRYWTSLKDQKQISHLFIAKADGSEVRDLTKGFTTDVPSFSEVAAGDGFDWAPDGKALAFETQPDQWKADGTNGEIFEVSVADGKVSKVSDNPAMDTTPRYSPDGKSLAWRAQRRPMFEADKYELWVMDRASGKVVRTTAGSDQSVGNFVWKGNEVLFTSDVKSHAELFRWPANGDQPQKLTQGLHIEAFALKGDQVLIQNSHSAMPVDLFMADFRTGATTRYTHHNEAMAKELGLNRSESFSFKSAPLRPGGEPQEIEGFVIRPVGFDPSKKYPVAFLVHGGPQSGWKDAWGHRWNPQTWAGRGYITVQINFRGSDGYGQAFTDAISKDWNGGAMTDLMGGLDAFLKATPQADPQRIICAGASYGGYAVNWLAGHYGDRFKAFICHAGIFNTESMQLATEELWFPKWEFGGWPWEGKDIAARWRDQSPHLAAGNFKKPMFVIHGELDYRVPYTEGLANYQVHQLRGIPSQLMIFPDEGHWILKPQNNQAWQNALLDWADRWAK